MIKKKNYFYGIDFLRWVAAFGVVLYHYTIHFQITEIKYKTFEVLEDERLQIVQLIDENNLSAQNYNKLSSLTFISICLASITYSALM